MWRGQGVARAARGHPPKPSLPPRQNKVLDPLDSGPSVGYDSVESVAWQQVRKLDSGPRIVSSARQTGHVKVRCRDVIIRELDDTGNAPEYID